LAVVFRRPLLRPGAIIPELYVTLKLLILESP
jgi:hypothetical protein